MEGRNKTDEELEEILGTFDENERHGLKFGLIPAEKVPESELTSKDVAQLIRLNEGD